MASQDQAMADQASWGPSAAASPSGVAGGGLKHVHALASGALRAARGGCAHVALGSLGVLAVSLFYFLSPLAAVTPALGADLAPARAAALTDSGVMRMIGAVGVLADLMVAVGLLALAHATPR